MNRIFLTVDVECHDILKENEYIWGLVNEEETGLKKILELGKKHNIIINFFLDFPEEKRYGEEYIMRIVNLIQKYQQPIHLHLHPNYLTGDDNRTFLWEYSEEEKRNILEEGKKIYKKYMKKDPRVFRAGRYGIDKETVEIISDVMPNIIECSYLDGNGKMCKLERTEIKAINRPAIYKGIKFIPNTTYMGFHFGKIKKRISLDVSDTEFGEYKKVLQNLQGKDCIITMHSWNFINKAFWRKKLRKTSLRKIKKFNKFIMEAQKLGYQFSEINEENFNESAMEYDVNLCNTLDGRVRSIYYNFFRFQEIAKLNIKYAKIYFLFYFFISTVFLVTLIYFLNKFF